MSHSVLPTIIRTVQIPFDMLNIHSITINQPLPFLYADLAQLNAIPTFTNDPLYDILYNDGIPQYEFLYVNSDGVEAIITGTYIELMYLIEILKSSMSGETDPHKLIKPYTSTSTYTSTTPINIPLNTHTNVTPIDKGKIINLKVNDKIYSGSGIVIFALDSTASRDIANAKLLMFRDSKTQEYSETGGKIDKPSPDVPNDIDILFKNAVKETHEESMRLCTFHDKSQYFIDIQSPTDNTYYRVYVYVLKMLNKDIVMLPKWFDENKKWTLDNFPLKHEDAYRETNAMRLFNYDNLEKLLKTYDPAKSVRTAQIQATASEFVTVRDRTLSVMHHLLRSNIVKKIISNNDMYGVKIDKCIRKPYNVITPYITKRIR